MYYFYRTFELFCFECMLKKKYEVFLRYEKKTYAATACQQWECMLVKRKTYILHWICHTVAADSASGERDLCEMKAFHSYLYEIKRLKYCILCVGWGLYRVLDMTFVFLIRCYDLYLWAYA